MKKNHSISTLILGLALIVLSVVGYVLLVVSGPASADGPPPVDARRLDQRLSQLSHPNWAQREEATRWLIRHHAEWMTSVPVEWRPEHPEARWRYSHVRDVVAALAELPQRLTQDDREQLRARLLRLHRQAGEAAVTPLLSCLERSEPRVRQRAVELLAAVPGLDLARSLKPVEQDPSPWVRRTLYELACVRDRRWAEGLLRGALGRPESELVQIEVVRAVRRVGATLWRDDLLRLWPTAATELRWELAGALLEGPGRASDEVLAWSLESGRYPLLIQALGHLDRHGRPQDTGRLTALLDAPEVELAHRAMAIIRRHGSPREALSLVPLLDHADLEIARFAAETLVDWKAEDFYGELAEALRRRPPEDRFVRIVALDGAAVAIPAPLAGDGFRAVPAVRPGSPPR